MGAPSRTRASLRRQAVAGAVLALVVAVAIGGWIAGNRVRSPEAAAAKAAAPEASDITAPVELRVLSSRVVTRGTVTPGRSTTVTGFASDEAATVTGVFAAVGDQLSEGDRIVEVSGRPIFVLEGEVPAFREMRPGMTGPDIEQLRAALRRLGCPLNDDEGGFGESTKECVTRLYTALGYGIVPTSDTEAEDLDKARTAVADAEEALRKAEDDLAEATAPPTELELSTEQVAVDGARRKVAQDAAAETSGALESGATVDAALMSLNAQLANKASTPADRAKAEAELDGAVTTAQTVVAEATEASVSSAEVLRLAEAKLAELTADPDVASETLAVEQAQSSLDRESTSLAELEAASGPIVPLGEVVFVDALPATVSSLNAEIGVAVGGNSNDNFDPSGNSSSSGGLAVLATAALEVVAYVPPSDAALVQVGMDVDLLDDGTSGDLVAGTLLSLSEQVESNNEQRGFKAIIEGVDAIPRVWTGRDVRVTFTAAATAGEVLVVPEAALTSSADGQARVEVLGDDGTATVVPVDAGLSSDGFVEVTPLDDAELNEGDLVIVGSQS
ncbi:hypothetical protein BH24ACT5_BH24ACT5_07090 [soil metagenome]